MNKRIIIIGAGPTGLGAAYRLNELGYSNWTIYEKRNHVGGLSASFTDEEGFTWDLGGHVLFSHYPYFNSLVENLLSDRYIEHQRECWIHLKNRWVPYPFQNNIRYLDPEDQLDCLVGLAEVWKRKQKAENFADWIQETFGDGIARLFMLPYNFKVWATPLERMDRGWIAERVSVVDFKKVLENVIMAREDSNWGPNNIFKYPLKGGIGALFEAFIPFIKSHLVLPKEIKSIDTINKTIKFTDGSTDNYDYLINTMPLDKLIGLIEPENPSAVKAAENLHHNGVLVVGIGVKKPTTGTKCWSYFPEKDVPFYRVTNFSFYSPWNVPGGDLSTYSSFLCETSFSQYKEEDESTIVERTAAGLIKTGYLSPDDRGRIVSRWLYRIDYAYPVPTLNRDKALSVIQPYLEELDIYSRGRFGCWRYEIGNMDHSVMMGVEIVDRLIKGKNEDTAGFAAKEGINQAWDQDDEHTIEMANNRVS